MHKNAQTTAERNKEILKMIGDDVPYRQIAVKFKISYQRVGQIWQKANPRGKKKIDWTISDPKIHVVRVKG